MARKELQFCDCSQSVKGVRPPLEIGRLLSSDCDAEISELKSVKTKMLALVQNIPEPHFFFRLGGQLGELLLCASPSQTVFPRDLLLAVIRKRQWGR